MSAGRHQDPHDHEDDNVTDIDPAQVARVAAKLRAVSRSRYSDPDLLTTTRLQESHDRSLKLAEALGSENRNRQPVKLTPAEQREVDRVVANNAEWFTTPTPTSDRSLDYSDSDRETARMLRELGLDR